MTERRADVKSCSVAISAVAASMGLVTNTKCFFFLRNECDWKHVFQCELDHLSDLQ